MTGTAAYHVRDRIEFPVIGELLTRWTIWLSLIAYFLVLAQGIIDRRPNRLPGLTKWLWTIGFFLLVLHVACAFHFYHHWSHARAMEHTARETEQLLGWRFGAGVYFNYLFLLAWAIDLIRIWRTGSSETVTRQTLHFLMQGFMLFIVINATIVFERGPVQWVALCGCTFLVFMRLSKFIGKRLPWLNRS